MTQTPTHPASEPVAAPDPQTLARFQRFQIGAIECVALSDGSMKVPLPPQPGASAGAPQVRYVPLSCLLLRMPETGRVILMDSGFGFDPSSIGAPLKSDGRLVESMANAGFFPKDVDVVLISHLDPDHISGLYDLAGAKTFPNADYYVPAEAVAFWSREDIDLSASPSPPPIKQRRLNFSTRLFELAGGSLKHFAAGDEIEPGISTLALPGHAPGQVGFLISNSGEKLLYTADAIVHEVLSVETPDAHNPMDLDPQVGIQTRKQLIQTLLDSGWSSFSPHFSWPSFGKVQLQDGRNLWKSGVEPE